MSDGGGGGDSGGFGGDSGGGSKGGGGDSGGGSKGGGGDPNVGNDPYGGGGGGNDPYGGGGGGNDPYGGGGGSDPFSGPNLTGPGPVGGDTTNTTSFNSNLPWWVDQTTVNSATNTGATPDLNLGGTGSVYDNLPNLDNVDVNQFTSGSTTPQVATSNATGAPTGGGAVAPAFDLSYFDPSNTYADLTSTTPIPDQTGTGSTAGGTGTGSTSGGTGGSTGNSNSSGGGVLSSLGLGGPNNGLNLGNATAIAGLANSLITGNNVSQSQRALADNSAATRQIAQQMLDQSRPLTQAGIDTVGTGQQMLGTGQQVQGQGQQQIGQGQAQTQQGAALQQYIATGTLPEGYEAQVQQAVNTQKQTIIQNYANRGLPTDPSKNSMLAQELAQVDNNIPAMREKLAASLADAGPNIVASGNQPIGTGNTLLNNGAISAGNNTMATGNQLSGNQLLQSGLQTLGMTNSSLAQLANMENTQRQQTGQAIANFAAALNGNRGGTNKGVTLNIGGNNGGTQAA